MKITGIPAMSQTPLQLDSYFFPKVHVEASPDFLPGDAPKEQDVQIDVNVGLLGSKDEPRRFQLTLDIGGVSAKDKPLPYKIEITAVAFISVDHELNHPDIERLVQVNGASMLYSSARELVLMVTGRGPWNAFQLPTINFHGVIPPSAEVKEATKKAGRERASKPSER